MTTLSKEEFKLLLSNSVASPDLDKVQDAIADLVAENERLSKLLRIEKIASDNCSHKEEANKLRTALAAAEARETKLRDELEKIACLGNGNMHGNSTGNCMAIDALAQPRDDSALREMIATAIDEFVYLFKRHVGGDGEFWLHELEDCRDSIRALAEKAKGK